jgi:hypothetical protein
MQNNLIPKEELMLQTFDPREVWQVSIGKETFTLTGKQAQLIKDASIAGSRGLVFFDGFAISVPHISFMTRIKSLSEVREDETRQRRVEEMKTQFDNESFSSNLSQEDKDYIDEIAES